MHLRTLKKTAAPLAESFEDLAPIRRRRARPGRDIATNIEITLDEVLRGASRELTVRRLVFCHACEGWGGALGTRCRACGGAGTLARTREMRVPIPAGVESGNQIRFAGAGHAGEPGAPPGDLYVTVRVRQHGMLRRRGRDVLCDVVLTYAEAAFGLTMAIPGLSGPEQLTIPAGVQAGSTIRLARRGLPSLSRAGRGDQVVRVGVETPVALSSEQAALLSGLAEQRPRRAAQLRRWSRT